VRTFNIHPTRESANHLNTALAPLKDVAVLRSHIGLAIQLGISIGAPLGGLLTDMIGWRCSFLGQSPMAFLCFTMAAWRLPSQKPEQHEHEQAHEKPDFNFLGICLLGATIAATMVLCQLIGDETPGSNTMKTVILAITIILGISFALNERFWSKDPLVPLWLLKTNGIGANYIAQFLIFFAQFGVC
jgi:MFS family permease